MAGRFSLPMPERRGGGQPWFRIGQLDVTTTVLVTLLTVGSFFVWAVSPKYPGTLQARWFDPLRMDASRVLSGEVWRVVTWPLVNVPGLFAIIGVALFWYFGRELEGLMGRNRFAWFLFLVVLVPGLLAVLLNLAPAGLRPTQFTVFLVFIAQYPTLRFLFNIPAWALGVVFLALEFLQLLGLRDTRGMAFTVVTLATAAVVARSYGLIPSLARYVPTLPVPGSDAARSSKRSRPQRSEGRRRASGRTVVDGPWGAAPATAPTRADTTALETELNSLLDKIHAGGLDSLTADEKRRLNELSKRLR